MHVSTSHLQAPLLAPTTLFVREKALIIVLEALRMIIFKDHVLLLAVPGPVDRQGNSAQGVCATSDMQSMERKWRIVFVYVSVCESVRWLLYRRFFMELVRSIHVVLSSILTYIHLDVQYLDVHPFTCTSTPLDIHLGPHVHLPTESAFVVELVGKLQGRSTLSMSMLDAHAGSTLEHRSNLYVEEFGAMCCCCAGYK